MSITSKALGYQLGGTNAKYIVRSVQPTPDGTLLVHWLNKQTPIVFEFGEFSSDGKSITQLRGREELAEDWKHYERRFRRC